MGLITEVQALNMEYKKAQAEAKQATKEAERLAKKLDYEREKKQQKREYEKDLHKAVENECIQCVQQVFEREGLEKRFATSSIIKNKKRNNKKCCRNRKRTQLS